MCEHLDEFSSVCLYFGLLFLKVGVSEIKLFHYKLCVFIYLHANESAKLAKKRFLFFNKKQKSQNKKKRKMRRSKRIRIVDVGL